ncbi:hypothetical protein [Herminiimonas sp. CN]|uniref:hypothetical protein n=1 Tax=Herminiimonas sp. CN TaxID=1349818 RepID=UPI000473F8CC|nr:hypothetical protein [Herminiimonas sp. CN]
MPIANALTEAQIKSKARAAAVRTDNASRPVPEDQDVVMQRAMSNKHYQSAAGSATVEAMNMSSEIKYDNRGNQLASIDTAPLLTNPMEYLDSLVSLAPASEYFATNTIVGSLGYSVCSQLLWAYRKANARAKLPEPTIDIFNGSYADMFEKRADKEMSEDDGHMALPEFDVTVLTGVYMQMLYMQRGNPDYAAKYPPKMPHELIHKMQTNDRDKELDVAYDTIEKARRAASPARYAIEAKRSSSAQAIDEHKARVHKVEMDYVLSSLRDTVPTRLTDDLWVSIPLHVQYRWSVSVYNQVVSAIDQEERRKDRDSDRIDHLYDIVNALHLELEAAARTAEVRTAFDQGRLGEWEDISVNAVIAQAAKPKLTRIPHGCSDVTTITPLH